MITISLYYHGALIVFMTAILVFTLIKTIIELIP